MAEIALALILLVGAGLMVKSFLRLRQTELGFKPDNLLTLRVALPSVEFAAITSNLPLSSERQEGKLTFTPVSMLFAPIFFVLMGLKVDLLTMMLGRFSRCA